MTKTNDITQHSNSDYSTPHSTENHTPVYIFLHMPKSAGTTFRVHVENNLEKDEVLPLYVNNDRRFLERDYVHDYIRSLPDERKAKLKLIYGHEAYFGIHRLLGREGKYFTFLRDPLPRTISWYNYCRQNNSWNDEIIEKYIDKGATPTLKQWLQYTPWVWNEAIGYFADYGYCQRKASYKPGDLDELLNKFFFIGLTDTFDDDALFIYNLLGVHQHFFKTQNVSKQYFKQDNKEDIADIVSTKNQYDFALYKKAVDYHLDKMVGRTYRYKVVWMRLIRAISPIIRSTHRIIKSK